MHGSGRKHITAFEHDPIIGNNSLVRKLVMFDKITSMGFSVDLVSFIYMYIYKSEYKFVKLCYIDKVIK